MKATELLQKQHEKVSALFEEIDRTDDTDEQEALFEELADNLAAHATIEEKLFYPAAYVADMKPMLREAVEEHLSMKRLLTDLMALSADDDSFAAKLKVLKEQIEHHVEEEEDELFPKIEERLGDDKLTRLGDDMQAMFEREIADEPREKVPGQTDEAPPLR